jgi:tRNA(Ile)-lysidine synthase
MLRPGEAVLLGVSGGMDSMALLHAMHQLSSKHHWRLVVCHFNHKLRGRTSDADEAFVREAARRLGLKFRSGRGAVEAFARRQKLSIEMAARTLRHQFFARSAAALEITRLALAHHSDDQVELFFLRLLRGAGLEGLRGMKPVNRSPADPGILLVRPLLGVSRGEIEAYARLEKIRFREDATNAQLDFERNRIRHELLPMLRERFRPSVDKTVLRLISIIESESEFVEEATRRFQGQTDSLFEDWHPAVQRRWLRLECLRLGIALDFSLIERLRKNSDSPHTVSSGLVLWRDKQGKVHSRAAARTVEADSGQISVELHEKGRVAFGGVKLEWKIAPVEAPLSVLGRRAKGRERFDADKVGTTIILRNWHAGDRFQPIGMKSAVKVQDLLTNLKVPREQRRRLVVATNAAGEIFWIEGVRMAERFKLSLGTTRFLEWRWGSGGGGALH